MTATVFIPHKGKTYAVQVNLANTDSSFQPQLAEPTSVSVGNQELLFKGKKASAKGDDTLEVFGLKGGTKVQMLGSTVEEVPWPRGCGGRKEADGRDSEE
jgi:hypothetical protein